MKQSDKLNALIDKVINEELDSVKIGEADIMTIAYKDPKRQAKKAAAKRAGITVVEDDPSDPSNDRLPAIVEETPTPPATEIAGKIAEMMDSLKAISEGTQDPKMKKIADKAAAQLEAAKQTLEALTAHEVMLHEKEQEMYVKQAAKKRKVIERYLKKTVKMPEIVEKLMKKLPDEKIAEMMRKSEKELDEQQLAGAMVRVALKESYIKLS